MDETPKPPAEASFSELTVELIQQAAALAGERAAAPIRQAGAFAARALAFAGVALVAFLLAGTFLGVAVGYALRRAPEADRWWICLLVAAAFAAIGTVMAILAPKGRKSGNETRGEEAAQ